MIHAQNPHYIIFARWSNNCKLKTWKQKILKKCNQFFYLYVPLSSKSVWANPLNRRHHRIDVQVIILASTWAASSLPLLYNAYLCQHSCFGQSWSQHFCHVSQWQQYHKPPQLLPQFLIQNIRKIISTLNWVSFQKHGHYQNCYAAYWMFRGICL